QPNNILRILPEGRAVLAAMTDAQKTTLEVLRERLLKIRAQRPRPLLDDKVLTDWNGLMIASMAQSGRLLNDPKLIVAARKAYAFVVSRLYKDRTLLHRWRDGEAAIGGMLSDHTFLAWGALELYRCTQDVQYLGHACSLMDRVIADFKSEDGGYDMISKQAETLLFTPSEFSDMALPSGNSVALLVLTELVRYTGVKAYETERQTLDALFAVSLPRSIDRRTISTLAMERQQGTPFEVVVVSPGLPKDAASILKPFRT
ncbi:MAG: thioredoxin domain-containing protein, partial [Planctomycetes bacterium]|nr:thioredoxin domain-containing protein [Planctomycetota bacterium]